MPLTPAERLDLQIKIRWAQDPCRRYLEMCTHTQREVMSSKARYRLVYGGNRSGKSTQGAWEIASAARRIHPTRSTSIDGIYVVFAPYREQIQDPWYKKLRENCELRDAPDAQAQVFGHPFIPDYEIAKENGRLCEHYTYGAGEATIKMIRLANGNKIMFAPSAGKHVWKTIEGKGLILGIVLDEAAGNEKLIAECGARLLEANSHPTIKREAGGGWLLWPASETKLNPTFSLLKEKCKSEDPAYADYACFWLPPNENPAIDVAEREKLRTLMSEEDYKIRMEGSSSAGSSMALWPQWNDAVNLQPKGHDYEIQATDNLWLFLDPGTHFTGMVLAAINKEHPRRLNVVRCWQNQRTTLEQDVRAVREELGGRCLEGLVYDQAARKVAKEAGMSVIGRLENIIRRAGYEIKIHRGMMKGRSEYAATVPQLRSFLRCPDDSPDFPTKVILNRDPASGCGMLRQQILKQTYTENAYELKEENVSKGNDHLVDALRYGASREPGWVSRPCGPKLWGKGTNSKDPDADKVFDRRSLSHDAAVAGGVSEVSARRARAKMKRFQNAGQW
jgi:hypothetical protein